MPKIVVLVSGSGSNLQCIIDAIAKKQLNCQIECVIADRECFALTRAYSAGISTQIVSRKDKTNNISQQISSLLAKDCDLIVLAGFLSILDKEFVKAWENKIINLHPSLLPKYGGSGMWGMHVHRAVITNKETESGCTIHWVTEQIDGGEILKQQKIPVFSDDTAEDLQQRIQQVEGPALVDVISKLLVK